MRATLTAALLLSGVASAAPSRTTRIWFDARAPFARPTVRATVDGRAQQLLLDTGSTRHVWSLAHAKAARLERQPEPPLLDAEMRRHDVARVSATVAVDGLGPLLHTIDVSDWVDATLDAGLDGKLMSGVLSPQLLVGDDALMLDLVRGELRFTDWLDGLARLYTARLTKVADLPLDASGHFIVTAQVGGDFLRLAIDTGAPSTMIYRPRGADVPPSLVRRSHRSARVQVGALGRDLVVHTMEPLGEPGFDGLLGMDVLRNCALLIEHAHAVLACQVEGPPARATASAVDVRARDAHARERLCSLELCVRELADGGFSYEGNRIRARFWPDGRLEIQSYDVSGVHLLPSTHDETESFLQHTRTLRYELAHAHALTHSFAFLPRHLAAVWGDEGRSLAERREILFALWNEAAEADDHELGWAGRRARGMIDRFIRRELPRGTALAFDDAELRRLNERRGRGPRFSPYDAPQPVDRDDE